MRRSVLAAALLMLSPGLRTARGWEDPPPLTPPALEPSAESPSAESPSAESPSPPKEEPHRPLLVIPGVTAPLGSATVRKPSSAPSLEGPKLSRLPMAGDDGKPRVSLSLTLEPIPPDEEEEAKPKAKEAKPALGPKGEPGPSPNSSSTSHGLLGRILGSEGSSSVSEDGITIEPHSDPAVEAAVKRRVEKQIQQELGDQVRDVEVFVKGREILIKAHASRFWRRRSARRTLDALPLPSGYRARVEMD